MLPGILRDACRSLGLVFLVFSLSLVGVRTTNAQGTWAALSPMPTARWSLAAATWTDGTIFAIGGFADSNFLAPMNTVEAYHAVSNTWTGVAPMPSPRGALAAATGGDSRIYAIGGFGGIGTTALNAVEAYDPGTGIWTTVAPMPTPRYFPAAVNGHDGRIYVIGGQIGQSSSSDYLNIVEIYDPSTNTWSTASPMPTARAQLAAAVGRNGLIYAIGGSSLSGFMDTVEVYDPVSNTWNTAPSMSMAHAYFAAETGVDGRIYAVGGHSESAIVSTVEAYDPGANAWSIVAPMLTAREGLAAAVGSDGRIYAIGGDGAAPDYLLLNTVEAYTVPDSDTTPPVLTATATKTQLWPPNGKMVPVTISGTITDTGSGVDLGSGSYSTVDSYGKVQPGGVFTINPGGTYSFTISLEASRRGGDETGRTYTVTISARDIAGNVGTATVVVTVPHDQGH